MDFSILPKVDRVIDAVQHKLGNSNEGHEKLLADAAREEIDAKRERLIDGVSLTKEELFNIIVSDTIRRYENMKRTSLRRVINATGVVLHTNLGRAPLAPAAIQAIVENISGYTNLEMDLNTGKRSSRYDHVAGLICALTSAEDAVVVNNNAAAVLLVLDTLAKGGEAVVSRGQLVEIGGSFRVPDIIASTGAVLHEVGTTNKTHLYDYENAVSDVTKCLLQVHPSNFVMRGFVEEVSTADLAVLAHKNKIPLIYDLGSGCLYPFSEKGIGDEPTPIKIMRDGADILTFSGDKLLGGPQAGIIIGKKEYIEKIKKNPLMRALRIDKLTVATLEATISLYRDGKEKEIPTIAMLDADKLQLKSRAKSLIQMLCGILGRISLRESVSPIGGGAMPDVSLPAWIIEIEPEKLTAQEFLRKLRSGQPAVLGYIREGHACFDVRTVRTSEMEELAMCIRENLP